jgi:hypothetical protein
MPRRKPPEPARLVFFLDRCLGAHVLPDLLRDAGMHVRTMQDKGFPPDVEDTAWIPVIAERGWAILTKDKNIRRDSLELRVVLATGAFYFTLGKADRSAREMGEIILHHRATIERLIVHREPPVVAQINATEVLMRAAGGELRPVKRRHEKGK